MKSSKRIALSVGTALIALIPAVAQAQDAPDGADIIVTARRTEERLQDVPISITVFNQQQIAERNVVSANDLAAYTPSLSSNSRFGNDTSSFAIRGFVQEAQTAPSVAVYFADVVAPRAQDSLAGGNNVPSGSFFDLQNVQVLKGPQGTLFGRNTTGGAVLLVPQKPTDRLEGYVEGSVGNYDMVRGQAVLNIPLSDTFKVRLGIDRMKQDGYLNNRSGIGPKDFNNTDYVNVRASIVADLTPDLENYLIFTYAKSNTNGNVPRLTATNTQTIGGIPCIPGFAANGTPLQGAAQLLSSTVCAQQSPRFATYGYYDVENSNPDAHLDVEQWQVINTTTWKTTDSITIKNIASYAERRQNQSANLFGDNIVVPSFFGPALAGKPFGYVNVFNDPNRDNTSQYTFTEELQLQGHAGDNDKLVYQLGAYFERSAPISKWMGTRTSIFASCTDVVNLQCMDILGTPTAPGGFVQNTLTRYYFRNIGFYGQATYKFNDQLSLTGGIRYTIDKASGDGSVRTFLFPVPNFAVPICGINGQVTPDPDNCVVSLTQKSSKPTWLIDLDYKPTPDMLFYAKYARGYRQGNVNPSNTLPITADPEKVDTYELGAKVTFRGSVNGYFNIAGFYNDFVNQQLQVSLTPDPSIPGNRASPSAAIVNAGKSRIQGIEVETMISPVEGLRFNAGYTYLKTKLIAYSPPSFAGFLTPTASSKVGGDLALSPHHKLSITGAYTLPLDESIGKITFGATYTYTSSQIASADSPFGVLPSTNLVNLNASWNGIAGTPIDLSLFATNVTKQKYPVYVGGTFYSAGFETLLIGPPRMYGLRLRYTFGR
ncbi:MAG TPA: TonB-dependent receptor [Novosphingobium sp.]